jgi:hypothetical protein
VGDDIDETIIEGGFATDAAAWAWFDASEACL